VPPGHSKIFVEGEVRENILHQSKRNIELVLMLTLRKIPVWNGVAEYKKQAQSSH
jgi:hypothetical protein